MPMRALRTAAARAAAQEGFTMLMALGVMLVASLLLVAGFKATTGDIRLSHDEATQKQAYYAALAGVQEYEYHLQANPDYWETCEAPTNTVPYSESEKNEVAESYKIELLPASTAPAGTKACSTSNPFGTMIQKGGTQANTFRIKSTGTDGRETRSLVASFRVVGFLNYAYFTQFEDEDPTFSSKPSWCEHYRPKRVEEEKRTGEKCEDIEFVEEDSVNGPMHTDDEAEICGKVTFGRAKESPPDLVEMNGGYTAGGSCSTPEPTFNTATGKVEKGTELLPPEGDTSLETYVKEGGDEYAGVTHLVLKGSTNEIEVTTFNSAGKEETKKVKWPTNGLIYVSSKEGTCGYTFKPQNSDNSEEKSKETDCGNVYVSGSYKESLTIGAEDDVIINGPIYPTSVENHLGNAPSGTETLGLIAGGSVRVYHPISLSTCPTTGGGSNSKGSEENLWIYAAILATQESFIVDNFRCGTSLGKLNIYGAIAQKFRGPVGTAGNTGYKKNYTYDERLAVDEPPYFLNPINAGWEVARETAPTGG